MKDVLKIHHDLAFDRAYNLNWYTGLYLGLPRVFMGVVRKKLVYNQNIESILIPLHVVKDPITGKHISINITDRYFFIGTKIEVNSEADVGLNTHVNTITLLRNSSDKYNPSKITAAEINEVIRNHVHKRRTTIQEDVTVAIIAGTFKDWFGTVESHADNPENVKIKFTSDDYDYTTEMPTILCRATC